MMANQMMSGNLEEHGDEWRLIIHTNGIAMLSDGLMMAYIYIYIYWRIIINMFCWATSV